MFESFEFETLTPGLASAYLGLALGLAFGVLAMITQFCLRRSLVGAPDERRSARGIWLAALAAAVIGTQGAVALGLIDFSEHRFMVSDLPFLAIILGGLSFGAGMVLTRGCLSRLTVLLGTGNLRSLTVLLVFAVTAHATLKGVLAPLRTGLGSVTLPLGDAVSLAALPGGGLLWGAIIAFAAGYVAIRSGARPLHLGLALLIGLLVPAAWVGTGFVLYDEFDPIALEGLSFTSPSADTLFWTIASTAIPAGFGVGLIGGVIAGALFAALLTGGFQWQSFQSPAQTGRYVSGAVLMGFGGVLAGGCTVGAGLSGVPTLSLAAILALASIVVGALTMDRALRFRTSGQIEGAAVPAE